MKNLLVIFLLSTALCAQAQTRYWQQQADHVIDVKLNTTEKTLDGFERITYTNNSPDTLRFIWFHLWPNAIKFFGTGCIKGCRQELQPGRWQQVVGHHATNHEPVVFVEADRGGDQDAVFFGLP